MHLRVYFFTPAAIGAAMAWVMFADGSSAGAQTIELRDGTTIKTLGVRRDGDSILANIQTKEGNAGEIGYAVNSVARIDFPEPTLIQTAPDLISKGPSEETLKQLAQAVAYYQPFLDVPGSWWKPLIRDQMDALIKAHRDKDLDAIGANLSRYAGADPDLARIVKFRQAAILLREGTPKKVLDSLEPMMRDENATAGDLAEGWLELGTAHLMLREYKRALLAFLHVPVFTPDRAGLMPAAVLGSARAYIGIDDKVHAKDSLTNLVASYPTTPEAAEAKAQLAKLAARAANSGGG